MDLKWGSDAARKFITNVGLITSDGPGGPNIMACEWTHHISYEPPLIAVCIGSGSTTAANIRKSKEFGVNLCATDQNVLSSVAGGYSGSEHDKIGALKELGFKFYKARKIGVPMVSGAAMNAECSLVREMELGDHLMLVGEAVAVNARDREPIAYHNGLYWKMSESVRKPSEAERKKIKETVEKYCRP